MNIKLKVCLLVILFSLTFIGVGKLINLSNASYRRWNTKCASLNGHTESRIIGYSTSYVNSGNTKIPVMSPIYQDYCVNSSQQIVAVR